MSSSRITTINRWLTEHGYDLVKLWADIDDVIIKVLISAHSVLKHNYRACFPNHYRGSACFEILGFDVLIDRKLKPYVLEVSLVVRQQEKNTSLSVSCSGQSFAEFHHGFETRSRNQRCSDLRYFVIAQFTRR